MHTITPGIFFMALFDIQRRFLISMGHSSYQLYVVFVSTFFHIGWNYLFIIKMKLGIIGIGYTATVSNLIMFLGNLLMTHCSWDMSDALSVSICNKKVWRKFCEYLVIGIPGTIIMMMAWGSYEILNIMAGLLGVHN